MTSFSQKSPFLGYIKWGLIILLSMAAFASGASKLMYTEEMATNMAVMNYSETFTRFLGVCWIAGAIALYFDKVRMLALLGMSYILFGAIASHFTAGHGYDKTSGAIAFLMIVLVIATLDGFWNTLGVTCFHKE